MDGSNLRFPHAKHMVPAGLKRPDGTTEVLDCTNCHTMDSGGRYMLPVRFEENCRRCHQLTFEPKHPEWRLAHGQPDRVAAEVLGAYSRDELFRPSSPGTGDDQIFAEPGKTPPPVEPPAAAALTQALAALSSSVVDSTCGICHKVDLPQGPGARASWSVGAVFVPANFFTKASFIHAKHIDVHFTCDTCHAAARTSNEGPMALLPRIATCRQCHAGESGASGHVASTCVACHGFHSTDPALRLPSLEKAANRARD
jgi:hypothetical protein